MSARPGELLALGFEGTALPEPIPALAAESGLGGVVLFRRNCPDLETVLLGATDPPAVGERGALSELVAMISAALARRPERPEIVLAFKARRVVRSDDADFDAVVPLLDAGRRDWLRSAIERVDPNHAWLDRLGSFEVGDA